jgi:ATP-dependent Lon protease
LPALKDRMEIIEIPSYVEEDKVHIAFDFLIPKQIKEHGLNDNLISFTEEAVKLIINSYTREAGVRNLERQIASICRGVAKDVAEVEDIKKAKMKTISAKEVNEYLGPKKFFPESAERINETGIAIGLAWTPVGGDILFIEASKMKGKGELKLTGQLGDVMKESAQAAMSYIRAKAEELGIEDNFYQNYDIHIHIPAGAIPKDGPSAGVTLYTALLSLLTNRRVRSDIAMTGEITLRGLVLPVGGIKEKVLAAHRAGIRTVLLPEKNEKDLVEVPDQIRDEMTFHFLEKMADVLDLVFEKKHEPKMAMNMVENIAINAAG